MDFGDDDDDDDDEDEAEGVEAAVIGGDASGCEPFPIVIVGGDRI